MWYRILRSPVWSMLLLGIIVIGIALLLGRIPLAAPTSPSMPASHATPLAGAATAPTQPTQSAGLDCVVPTNWLKCALADIDNGIINQELVLMQGGSGVNGDAVAGTASAMHAASAQDGNEPPLFGFIFSTDPLDTYANPIVINWHDTLILPMVDALVIIIVLVSGYLVLFGDLFADGQSFAKHVLPRIVVALFAAHASLLICQMVIDLNDGLITGFAAPAIIAFVQIVLFRDPNDIGSALVILLYVIVLLIFIVQMIGRLALLNLLIILSPLGLICWALPQTRAWGEWWVQLFVASVFVQFIQVAALALGMVLLAAAGGGTSISTSAFNLIWAIATMLLALRIPDFLRQLGLHSGGNGGARVLMFAFLAARIGAMIGTGGTAAPVVAATSAGSLAAKPLENGLQGGAGASSGGNTP
jgi:hypothetical protein